MKLLRFLGEHSFERVGSNKTIKSDVRIIAATNRNLYEMVKKGTFREDLYYRLRVVEINLPPLREKKIDIPLLAANFIKEFAIKNGKVVTGINDEAMEYLLKYDWPGNVRELRTTIEHAVVFCKGDTITARDLPLFIRQPNRPEITSDSNTSTKPQINAPDSPLTIKEAEKQLIINALNECGGNRTLAAKRIGISRRTLHRKLKEYDIKDI